MKPEKVVLCASSKYEQKFYLNEEFKGLPEEIKKELKITNLYEYSLLALFPLIIAPQIQ